MASNGIKSRFKHRHLPLKIFIYSLYRRKRRNGGRDKERDLGLHASCYILDTLTHTALSLHGFFRKLEVSWHFKERVLLLLCRAHIRVSRRDVRVSWAANLASSSTSSWFESAVWNCSWRRFGGGDTDTAAVRIWPKRRGYVCGSCSRIWVASCSRLSLFANNILLLLSLRLSYLTLLQAGPWSLIPWSSSLSLCVALSDTAKGRCNLGADLFLWCSTKKRFRQVTFLNVAFLAQNVFEVYNFENFWQVCSRNMRFWRKISWSAKLRTVLASDVFETLRCWRKKCWSAKLRKLFGKCNSQSYASDINMISRKDLEYIRNIRWTSHLCDALKLITSKTFWRCSQDENIEKFWEVSILETRLI